MVRRFPTLALRLPFAMVDRHLRLEQVLAADRSRSWAESLSLLSAMAMSGPEKRFAGSLLRRKRNVWLFRCHQRRACGDFIAVDMSAASPRSRLAWVLELKSGSKLKIGCAPGIQMRASRAAVKQLADARIVSGGNRFALVCGDYDETLQWLLGGMPIPAHLAVSLLRKLQS